MTDREQQALDLLNSFATDPVGTYAAVGAELEQLGYQTRDGRIDELYDAYTEAQQISVYDQMVEHIAATNPDVDPNRFHLYVSASGGDWDQALDMYRADVARVLSDYRLAPVQQNAGPAATDYQAEGRSPQEELHRRVDDLMQWRREQRGR